MLWGLTCTLFFQVIRSGRLDLVCRKRVLRNFAKFTGKHLCQSLLLTLISLFDHSPFIFQKELIQCYYNFMQLWNNLFKVGWKLKIADIIYYMLTSLVYLQQGNVKKSKKLMKLVSSCEFWEISKNIFFTEHLWATASGAYKLNRGFRDLSKQTLVILLLYGWKQSFADVLRNSCS